MDNLTMNTAALEHAATISEIVMNDQLGAHSDETLRALLRKATAILDGRTTTRRREAIAEIQKLAKENGLTVSVKKPARKRGRPCKASTATA